MQLGGETSEYDMKKVAAMFQVKYNKKIVFVNCEMRTCIKHGMGELSKSVYPLHV